MEITVINVTDGTTNTATFDFTNTAKCPECDRTFDLTNTEQAADWFYGHDCE